jgi:hypothetical protein
MPEFQLSQPMKTWPAEQIARVLGPTGSLYCGASFATYSIHWRHDSFKEGVKHLDNDHHESGQGKELPVVLEPGAAALYPGPEI